MNATTGTNPNNNWIVDSGASHHITSDLQNLSVHSECGGNDDIIIGDGNPIPIIHIGSTDLVTPKSTFHLNNVLCAPQLTKSLLSISKFCHQNNTSIEFFPDYFVVKDLSMRASLIQGLNKRRVRVAIFFPHQSPRSSLSCLQVINPSMGSPSWLPFNNNP